MVSHYTPQVSRGHYEGSYLKKHRWLSYWYQISLVREFEPATLLEVGVGDGTVTQIFRRDGVSVTTCDIAEDLRPDVTASVTGMPFEKGQFDVVLAGEVLEHLRFEDVPVAFSELARVAKKGVVISVPDAGLTFFLSVKVPFFPWATFFFKIPRFWKIHRFDGEHYWELGTRGFSVERLLKVARASGLTLRAMRRYGDDPGHLFFSFEPVFSQ